jgi:hypothetical protein
VIHWARSHLTYANVMATLAVFAVLAGGTAWALSKNSVSSKHIKDNAVAFKDLKSVKGWTKGVPVTGEDADSGLARDEADTVVLAKRGTATIYGKCYRNTSTDLAFAGIFVSSSEDGAILRTAAGGNLVGTDYLDDDTSPSFSSIASAAATNNTAVASAPDSEQGFTIVAAGGKLHLTGVASAAAKNGTPSGGDGPFGSGDGCLFGGYVVG